MRAWIIGIFILIIGISIAADVATSESAPPPQIYQYAWTADTITNTESDTLTGVTLFYDLFNYNFTVTATQLSGSTSIIAVLQESNASSGSDWYEVERDTLAGAGTLQLSQGGNDTYALTKGVRQRVVLTGIGTQSSRYTLRGTWKKTQR